MVSCGTDGLSFVDAEKIKYAPGGELILKVCERIKYASGRGWGINSYERLKYPHICVRVGHYTGRGHW